MFFFKKKEAKPQNLEKVPAIKEDFMDVSVLLKYIENKSGINLFPKESIVKERIINFLRKKEIYSFISLLRKLPSSHQLWLDLMDLLSTNETFFFREIRQIQDAIKELKKQKPPYRILCAPSSSGEEIYTVLILLLEAGFLVKDISIVGIDISNDIIQKAQTSIYDERSIHRVPKDIVNKYFIKLENNKYQPIDILRKHATFKQCNIFDKEIVSLGKFDIIFSRNLFIYFDDDTKIKAYNIFKKLLKEKDAQIFLGHADISSKLSQHIKLKT